MNATNASAASPASCLPGSPLLERPLLEPDEPAPVIQRAACRDTPFVFACDHAGRQVPRRLGRLGLAEPEFDRHIAWDIGAPGLAEMLAEAFGAPLVMQAYSRLVIDCNRPLGHPTSIPTISERTAIPGNQDLSAEQRAARARAIFDPYHAALTGLLDARRAAGAPTVLIAVHSFTPVFMDRARPWHAGILYHLETRLAAIMIDLLRAEPDLVVGDNEPYVLTGTSDYTVPFHAERRGLPYLELEVRQDLIARPAGQRAWAERLARLTPQAWDRYRS